MSAAGKADVHGLLVVDKPAGPTSHDVVAEARRAYRTRRVGHAGTLDPMATGVLVLLFGEATKLCEIAAGANKTYLAEVTFGYSTDSHDAWGSPSGAPSERWTALGTAELESALTLERKRALQRPPAVSALKVGGRRAHELSRAGAPPDLPARPVRVLGLELQSWRPPRARLALTVSKGYYVRALARDLGEALGVPAHLSELRRTQSGDFTLQEACPWPPEPSARAPLPLQRVLPRLLPVLRLGTVGVLRARQGQVLDRSHFVDEGIVQAHEVGGALAAWTDADGAPVALGEYRERGFRVRRGFAAGAVHAADADAPLIAPASPSPGG